MLKVAIQNRVRNVTMYESNKKALAHYTETLTCRSLRLIKTPVVEPQNEFTGARAPTVPYGSDVQVPVKYDFSEKFEREQFDGENSWQR